MFWPFEDSTQFPPDCFRQPRTVVSWELLDDVLVWLLWSELEVLGCWLGVC